MPSDTPFSDLAQVNPLRPALKLRDLDPVSFIPMGNVSESGRWTEQQSRPYGEVRRGYTYCAEGDVLFAKITPCTENGKGFHAIGLTNGVGFASTEFHVLRAKEGVDPGYIFQWSVNLPLRLNAAAHMTGSAGQQRVPAAFFSRFTVLKLPLPEQSKIAEVLSTVDRAIEETEALIAKQQRIKTGLMQDLLTRGIDEHGNLRSEQTHKFKDSPLGRIPVEWEVAGLSTRKHAKKHYLKTGPFGSSLKISDWVEHGIPVITIGALGEGSFEKGDLLYVSMAKAEQLAAYALEPGDIVFSRVADVGRSVVVTERERDWIMSSNMMRISIDVAKADPNFLRLNIVKHPGVRAQIRQTVNASGREVANQQVLDALRFPWPSVDEQRRIVRTVAQQSEQIVRKEACLAKFRRAKAGLMQDLLTGNRRVTALLEQREGATA